MKNKIIKSSFRRRVIALSISIIIALFFIVNSGVLLFSENDKINLNWLNFVTNNGKNLPIPYTPVPYVIIFMLISVLLFALGILNAKSEVVLTINNERFSYIPSSNTEVFTAGYSGFRTIDNKITKSRKKITDIPWVDVKEINYYLEGTLGGGFQRNYSNNLELVTYHHGILTAGCVQKDYLLIKQLWEDATDTRKKK